MANALLLSLTPVWWAAAGRAMSRLRSLQSAHALRLRRQWFAAEASASATLEPPKAPGSTRTRLALSQEAAEEEQLLKAQNNWGRTRLLIGSGMIMGGLWQLTERHGLPSLLAEYGTDMVIAGAMGTGLMVILWPRQSTDKKRPKKPNSPLPSPLTRLLSADEESPTSQAFSFELLNERFESSQTALEELVQSKFPHELQQKLEDQATAEAGKLKAQRKDFVKETTEWVARHQSEASASQLHAALRPRCFVYDFDTTAQPQRVPPSSREKAKQLDEAVSFLQSVQSPGDQVVIRLASPGGSVADFGHAASALARLRETHHVTACVDSVAASGGYMVACVAHEICAAPFALIGSIGVVAGLPNFAKALDRADIDYLLFTAGKYKRTVTLFAPVDDDAKSKFQNDLDDIHEAFKAHVQKQRSNSLQNVDDLATGEAWLAVNCPAGLVDRLATSAQLLQAKMNDGLDVILVKHATRPKRSLFTQLTQSVRTSLTDFLYNLSSPFSLFRPPTHHTSFPPQPLASAAPHPAASTDDQHPADASRIF